jgi:hypothetical protein
VREFFRRATGAVEEAIATTRSPARRVTRYLEAVAEQLRAASPAFRADVAAFRRRPRCTSERHRRAAARVRALIEEGISAGAFRRVPAAFVGEVVTATMRRITSGRSVRPPASTTPRPMPSWPGWSSPRSAGSRPAGSEL